MIALTSRTFLLQIISLVATFILTVLLDPAVFGVFFVVSAAINFLNYFSDIGLAAALIQKKEEPSRVDLITTFTIQQTLVVTAVILALMFSQQVAGFFNLGTSGLFLFRILAIAFFLSSLKTIPSVLLERKLNFQKLVIPQIIETVSFYAVTIILAAQGYGVVSFAWGALVRGITGTAALYLLAPWKPGLGLNQTSAHHLLTFGIPYQANSFLALVKDDLLTVFLGKWLPFAAVGYIGWAKKWAEIALRLIMDNIIKITFPAFSRLQHDMALLKKAIEKSILLLSLLTLPIAVGMVFMMRPFIDVVPKYSKWEPALLSFYLFTISSVLAALSSPLVNALNAIRKVHYTFYLMIMWTTLTWIMAPLFISFFGFNGVAIAASFISITSFVPIFLLRKVVSFRLVSQIIKPVGATLVMILSLLIVFSVVTQPIWQLIIGIGTGLTVYTLVIYILMGKELAPYISLLREKR